MTTAKRIKEWFDEGVEDKQRWMVIICDTFDHDDYPVYFGEGQADECKKRIREAQRGVNMQRLMEVYDLTINKEEQFVAGTLVMNTP